MLMGVIEDLMPPPTTHAQAQRSSCQKASEHSQRVEINSLLGVGCFKPVDKGNIPPKVGSHILRRWIGLLREDEVTISG